MGTPVSVIEVSTDADRGECLAIRRRVFCDEQGVDAAIEVSDEDACIHFLAVTAGGDGEGVGTGRLLPISGEVAKVQRMAVLRAWRRRGIGRALMAAMESAARARGFAELVMHAQCPAVPFYLALGYRAEGDEFEEAGIPHRCMRKALR